MDISIVLAQIFGIIFSLLGLSMIFNKKLKEVVAETIPRNEGFILEAGFLTLCMGSVVVVLNNLWTSGLPLFVTILGWLMLIKGTCILLFPNFATSFYRKVTKGNIFAWVGALVLILGVVLLYR